MADEDDTSDRIARLVFPPNQRLKIWERIETTDPRYTKRMDFGGANLTSINAEYQIKKMTDIFGTCGVGWGFHVEHSGMEDCGPCYRQWQPGETPFEEGRILVHTANVMLWFVLPEDQGKPIADQLFHRVYGTGHTPFRQQQMTKVPHPDDSERSSNDRRIVEIYSGGRADFEYEKKSITDALTKAMSFLGMSADVRMGEYDDRNYVEGVRDEFAIANAADAEAERIQQAHDFKDWFDDLIRIMSTSKSVRELELIYKPALVRVKRQGTQDQVAAFEELKSTVLRALIKAERDAKAAREAVAEVSQRALKGAAAASGTLLEEEAPASEGEPS